MNKFFFSTVLLFILLVNVASAYSLVTPTDYNDEIVITTDSEWYLAELNDFPHNYTLEIEEEVELEWQLMIPESQYELSPPRVLLLQVLDRGVAEVLRINEEKDKWTLYYDQTTKDNYYVTGNQYTKLDPGRYKLEVSSVANDVRYVLRVGDEDVFANDGYFSVLLQIFALKSFHDKSFFSVLATKYLYIPLGVLLLVFVYTQRKRLVGLLG